MRAGVVATRAYRVVQQQGYLGFEESTRRDFAKLGGQAIKVMKGLVQGRMETVISPRSWLASAKFESDVNYPKVARC